MSREAISPSEARALWPPSAQIHVDQGAPSSSTRLHAEKLVAVPADSTTPRPLSKFSIALALWVLPGGLLMQSDGQVIVGKLFADPLRHAPTLTLALGATTIYVVATSLLLAISAQHLVQTQPRSFNVCLFFFVALAVFVSLACTVILALAFFFSLLIWCFPALI